MSADTRGERSGAALHTLAVSMQSMMRLLDRRDADGALVPADATLIRNAVAAAREEIGRLSGTLEGLTVDPTYPHREKITVMLATTAKLEEMLVSMDDAVHDLER